MLVRLVALSFTSSGLGFLLELLLAWKYGAGPELDAFRLSQSVFLIAAHTLVGQLIPHITVPLFTGLRAARGNAAASAGFLTIHAALALAGAMIFVVVVLGTGPIARLIAPGLAESGARLLPSYLILMSAAATLYVLAGAIAAVLSIHGQFAIAMVPQLCVNACLIAAVYSLPTTSPILALGGGTLTGAAIAYAVHVAAARRLFPDVAAWLRPHFRISSTRALLGDLLLPLSISIAFGHAGTIFIQRSLSLESPGSIALFSFAVRLTTLIYTPAALYGNTVFPALAEALAQKDTARFSTSAHRALARTLLLSVPIAVLVWLVRLPLVTLLFGTGKLDTAALNTIAAMFGWIALSSPFGAVAALFWKIFSATRSGAAIAGPPLLSLGLLFLILPPLAAQKGPEGIAIALSVYTAATAALQLLAFQLLPPPEPQVR